MSPDTFAQNCILLGALALPYLLFVMGNSFRTVTFTLLRALVAIAGGWCMFAAYAIAARAIAISAVTPSELMQLYDRDGAPLAFAAVFGWVPATIIVLVAWLAHAVVARKPRRTGSNNSFKPKPLRASA